MSNQIDSAKMLDITLLHKLTQFAGEHDLPWEANIKDGEINITSPYNQLAINADGVFADLKLGEAQELSPIELELQKREMLLARLFQLTEYKYASTYVNNVFN